MRGLKFNSTLPWELLTCLILECAKLRGSRALVGLVGSCLRGSRALRGLFVGPEKKFVGCSWVVRESRKKVRGLFVSPEKKFVGCSWVQKNSSWVVRGSKKKFLKKLNLSDEVFSWLFLDCFKR